VSQVDMKVSTHAPAEPLHSLLTELVYTCPALSGSQGRLDARRRRAAFLQERERTLTRGVAGREATAHGQVRSALRLMCDACKFVRRRGGVLFVVCRTNPKHKQRQGIHTCGCEAASTAAALLPPSAIVRCVTTPDWTTRGWTLACAADPGSGRLAIRACSAVPRNRVIFCRTEIPPLLFTGVI
jgi:ribosomal protein L36